MPVTVETVQMNTRIGRALKQEGDTALALAGFTPSEAVRALWALAVRERHNPAAFRDLLSGRAPSACEEHHPAEAEESLSADPALAAHIDRLQHAELLATSIGIDFAQASWPQDDDALRDQTLVADYLGGEGL